MSTADPPPPDNADLRGLARSLRELFEIGARTLGTEGVTASFVKEMIRRTVLASLRAGERPPLLRDAHFSAVLTEMNGEHHALTRSLLGVGPGTGEPPGPQPGFRAAPPMRRHRLGR